MAQKRQNTDKEEIAGFIHNVSPVKMSRKNTPYFNAKLQTEHDILPIVCYSPNKRSSFLNAQTSKSAIKLTNVRLTPGKLTKDIHANFSTSVVSLGLNESLPYTRKLFIEEQNKDAKDISIKDIKLQELNQVDKYNIKGKVVNIGEIKQANIHGDIKQFQDVIFHDGNDYITVTLFENIVGKVNIDGNYIITNVKLRIYNDVKLTSTRETMINTINEEFKIPSSFTVNKSASITGTVISARFSVKQNCPACQKSMPNIETSQNLITCSMCNTRIKKSAIITQATGMLQIKSQTETEKLTCQNHTLFDFLTFKNLIHLLINKTEIEDYFLGDDIVFKFEFDQHKNITHITQQ